MEYDMTVSARVVVTAANIDPIRLTYTIYSLHRT